MEIKSSREAYTLRQSVLSHEYGKRRAEWENQKYKDDRRVFCNIYDMLIEACEAMKSVENNLICVAFNSEYKSRVEELDQIAIVFEGR